LTTYGFNVKKLTTSCFADQGKLLEEIKKIKKLLPPQPAPTTQVEEPKVEKWWDIELNSVIYVSESLFWLLDFIIKYVIY